MRAAPRIIAYLASWGVQPGRHCIADIPAGLLTHVCYAFGNVGRDGCAALGHRDLDAGNFAQLRTLKRRHPHLKIMISLGGWTGSRWFSDAAASAEGRRRLVDSTLDVFMHDYPGLFDGIDVDWEFPVAGGLSENTVRPDDERNYTLLLQEYRRGLDELGARNGCRYELTIAASARPHEIANLELDRLPGILDYINVMTYDYNSTSAHAHFNAPLRAVAADPAPEMNVAATMRVFTEAGVPRDRLVVGVPFFGRAFGNVAPANGGLLQSGDHRAAPEWGSEGIDYRVLIGKEPERNGFTRHWNAEAQVPWLYDPQARIWITYDDPESIAAKAAYVHVEGFGGVMFWELGADDGGALLEAVLAGLGRAQ